MAALAARDGAVAQSIGIAFRALQVAMAALVVLWLLGNVRRVPPDQQAVILRFGRVVGVQQSGLVYTWPRPFEAVELVPGPTRQQGLAIDASHRAIRGVGGTPFGPRANRVPADAGAFLTGEGGVVILQAWMTWHVTRPAAFYLARERVDPTMQRLFAAAATEVAASHQLDDFLAVRAERAADPEAQSRRQSIRGELVDAINRRIAALPGAGDPGLGVEVSRIDLTPTLPPSAKDAFDQVLLSAQLAEQTVATARTEALTTRQAADQDRDATIARAKAVAVERVATAQERTAAIVALQARAASADRPGVLEQIYRDRIARVLQQAGGVSAIDLSGGNHVIVSGAPTGSGPNAAGGPIGASPLGRP